MRWIGIILMFFALITFTNMIITLGRLCKTYEELQEYGDKTDVDISTLLEGIIALLAWLGISVCEFFTGAFIYYHEKDLEDKDKEEYMQRKREELKTWEEIYEERKKRELEDRI